VAACARCKTWKIGHKCNWIRQLLTDGVNPEIEILEEVTQDTWQARERYWIQLYKDSLTNATDGGEGLINPSSEVRKRISETVSKTLIGNSRRKGIAHTEESKRTISEGLKTSALHKERQAKWAGVDRHANLTDDQKAEKGRKISESKLGKKRAPFSEETKRKMSEARTGKKIPKSSEVKMGSKFINNGTIVKQLKAGEPLPEGWKFGMKLNLEKSNG